MSISFPSNPPPSPGFSQAQIRIRNVVQQNTIQFNLDQQKNNLGRNKWAGNLTVDRMPESQARQWKAWMTSMRGKRGTFKVGDPGYFGPYGNVSNQGTVKSIPANKNFVIGEGYAGSTTIFKRGDMVEISDELKIIIRDITTESNGNALLAFVPPIRDTSSAGQSIIHTDPKGEFRFDTNSPRWNDETVITNMDFPIMEAA